MSLSKVDPNLSLDEGNQMPKTFDSADFVARLFASNDSISLPSLPQLAQVPKSSLSRTNSVSKAIPESILRAEDKILSTFIADNITSQDWMQCFNSDHYDMHYSFDLFSNDLPEKEVQCLPPPITPSEDWAFEAYNRVILAAEPAWKLNEDDTSRKMRKPSFVNTSSHLPASVITSALKQPTKAKTFSKSQKEKKNSKNQYVKPTDGDVLLGRGGKTNKHPGNKRYLAKIDKEKIPYRGVSKREKTRISESIVNYIHQNRNRFLEEDKATGKWYEVNNLVARKKVSQALREVNTPEERLRKRMKYAKNRPKNQKTIRQMKKKSS